VQLFASQYYSEAKYEQQIAREIFTDSVFILYDVPYYKVLIGNAETEKAGRRLLNRARAFGYNSSWLIKSPPDSLYFRLHAVQDTIAVEDSLSELELPDDDLQPEPQE